MAEPDPARSPSTSSGARSRRRRPGIETTFPLDEFTRARLLNGWDDIGLTLRHEDEIDAYEAAPARLAPQYPLTGVCGFRIGRAAESAEGVGTGRAGLQSPPGPRRRLPRGAGGQPASGDPVEVELRT